MNGKLKEEIIKEADRIEECCEYSSKSHYNTSKEWNIGNLCLNIPIAILAAITVFVPNTLKTIFAIITAVLAAIQACTRPTDCSKVHKIAADGYSSLKNQVRFFKNIEIQMLSDEDAIQAIKKFGTILDGYNSVNPQPSITGYKNARKGVKDGECDFRIDNKEEQ